MKPAASQDESDLGGRERILRESTRLFARHGFEGTSLRMIAEAVGVQKGSLVYHFDSKDRIREAVLDQLIDRWKDVLPQLILAASTGENRFERMMAECLGFFREDPNRARFILRELLDHPEGLKQRLAAQVSPWVGLLAERIEAGKREGIIHADVDPLLYVWGIVVMMLTAIASSDITGSVIGAKAGPERAEREIVRIAYTSLFLTGAAPALPALVPLASSTAPAAPVTSSRRLPRKTPRRRGAA